MGYIIKRHKDFVNIDFDKNVELYRKNTEPIIIKEAIHNDVTLSNSLMGQLFGWIFSKIGAKIKQGQMKNLLQELAQEFSTGQRQAIASESITQKDTIYTSIVALNNKINEDNVDINKFKKDLNNSISDIEKILEQKNVEPTIKTLAKDVVNKLKTIAGEEEEIDDIDDTEDGLDDEIIEDSIKYPKQLTLIKEDASFILSNILEKSLNKSVSIIDESNLYIENLHCLNYKDVENYFHSMNIDVTIKESIMTINSYDRKEYVLENSNSISDILYDLSSSVGDILYAPVELGNNIVSDVIGVGFSTQSDVEEKSRPVYAAIINAVNGKVRKSGEPTPINFTKYLAFAKKIQDKRLISDLNNIVNAMNKFEASKNDVSGFKASFNQLVRSLNSLFSYLEVKIEEDSQREREREEKKSATATEQKENTTDTGIYLPKDSNDVVSINTARFKKLGNTKTSITWLNKNDEEKNGFINPNQPEDLDEEVGKISVITVSGGTVAIDGKKVINVGGVDTPNGILNRDQEKVRKQRELSKDKIKNYIDREALHIINKPVKFYKTNLKGEKVIDKDTGDYTVVTGTVASYDTQLKELTAINNLIIKYGKDDKPREVVNAIDNIIEIDGKVFNREQDVERIKNLFKRLFPNMNDYEKEVRISEREKKRLLDKISVKARDTKTLINPLKVLKIFGRAHDKYTVEDYDSIPDGRQGSTLQGKGKGVNKKKNYKKMPDGSGRQTTLFRQWNEGVIDLLDEYGDYVPDELKKFIIKILNDNVLFGNSGAQAKLLQDYFNIKVDMKDLISSKGSKMTSATPTKTDVYIESKDTVGKFEKPTTETLQMKKENFKNLPFILEGKVGSTEVSYICYYLDTMDDLILFKFKGNNMDFLNNYKRSEQQLEDKSFSGTEGTDVLIGAIKTPSGANKDLRKGSDVTIWFTENSLTEPIKSGKLAITDVYYLVGINDNNIMRLDTKTPGTMYNDSNIDIKYIKQKFKGI